jgi:hypothetical protein
LNIDEDDWASTLNYNRTNGYQTGSNNFFLGFYGTIEYVNLALSLLQFGPKCPFTTGMTITLDIKAQATSGSANGILVSVSAGEAVLVNGPDVVSIIYRYAIHHYALFINILFLMALKHLPIGNLTTM